jgi:flavin reductase (DIM6/NTAB) family NADH-FMN oxidoreductase RutF
MHLIETDLKKLEDRYRANFINSIHGFKCLTLIGTIDKNKKTNLAVFNSIFHLGANPALVGFVVRPDSVVRHTLDNIIETGFYTLNNVKESYYKQAHQTSARYAKEISEFSATGLHEEFSKNIIAPYVLESSIKIGLEKIEVMKISYNNTLIVVGRVIEIFAPDDCISNDGFIDIEKAGSITVTGLDSYHSTQRLSRLSYAKIDKTLN